MKTFDPEEWRPFARKHDEGVLFAAIVLIDELNARLDEARRRIAELERQAPRWIPVEESEPQGGIGNSVLMTYRLGRQWFNQKVSAADVRQFVINCKRDENGDVPIFWMPLPAPPAEEEDALPKEAEHYEGCWKVHHECALKYIAELEGTPRYINDGYGSIDRDENI